MARQFEWRSVYSARIHLGRTAAAWEKLPVPNSLRKVVSRDYEVVSAAERYPQLAHPLLATGPGKAPLYVVDEHGALVGEIPRRSLSQPKELAVPLEMATATDLSTQVPALPSSITPRELEERIRQSGQDRLPIIDASSGRIVGVAQPRVPC